MTNGFLTRALPGTDDYAPYGERTPAPTPGGYSGETAAAMRPAEHHALDLCAIERLMAEGGAA